MCPGRASWTRAERKMSAEPVSRKSPLRGGPDDPRAGRAPACRSDASLDGGHQLGHLLEFVEDDRLVAE